MNSRTASNENRGAPLTAAYGELATTNHARTSQTSIDVCISIPESENSPSSATMRRYDQPQPI
eukprot:IDg6910t1